MPSTMPYSQGDIVLVSFPFTDLTSTKRRPALRPPYRLPSVATAPSPPM